MKKTLLIMTLCVYACLHTLYAQDTVSIDAGKNSKVLIYTNKTDVKNLKKVDFNKVIAEVAAQIDTAQREEGKIYKYDYQEKEHHITIKTNKKSRNSRHRNFANFDFGLNNYLEAGKFPDQAGKAYGLKTWNSQTFGFNFNHGIPLNKNDKQTIYLNIGIGMDWYNFRFLDQNYIVKNETSVEFRDYTQDFNIDLKKSKLVVSYLNLPLNISGKFPIAGSKENFKASLGGYFGYRIGSFSKVSYEKDSEKTKENFYLNNFRYGLDASIGYNWFSLFFKYDLNPLFSQDKGPNLNAFSFGIRL